jgi:hypothetical protein
MSRAYTLAVSLICAGLIPVLHAADFTTYRGIKFDTSISVVAKQVGRNATDARTLHKRPAVIQEMDWLPHSNSQTDPVNEGVLYFLNGELFRIVVTYDRYRVEGMTSDDIIAAISATYGAASRPTELVAYHSIYGESAPAIARWEDSEYAYNLVRTGDESSYALILYLKRLDLLAQAAMVEAARLDAQEAPLKEQEKEKQRDEERRLSLEKARLANKPNFRP